MSEFRAGQYVIRFVSQNDSEVVGGVATANLSKPNQPVRLEALSISKLQLQNWAARPAEDGQWLIELWHEGSVVSNRLSIRDPFRPPTGPVITTSIPIAAVSSDKLQQQEHWIVTPVKIDGLTDTYTLRPATKAVGVDYYVGVLCDELHIRAIDITDPHPKPCFQFIKIATDLE